MSVRLLHAEPDYWHCTNCDSRWTDGTPTRAQPHKYDCINSPARVAWTTLLDTPFVHDRPTLGSWEPGTCDAALDALVTCQTCGGSTCSGQHLNWDRPYEPCCSNPHCVGGKDYVQALAALGLEADMGIGDPRALSGESDEYWYLVVGPLDGGDDECEVGDA